MKVLLSTLFCTFSSLVFAQTSRAYTANFNAPGETMQTTQVYAYPITHADFHVLSAYTFSREKAQLSFRLKRENSWSNWIAFEPAHNTEGQARQAFEGHFVYEEFDSIQFGGYGPLSQEVKFRMYMAGSAATNLQATSATAGKNQSTLASCSCAQPLVCLRNCWCPDGSCPKDLTPTPTNVSHFIVHHSAGGNNATDYAQVVQSYWDLHVNTNGWDDIGYNWLIDPNGVIYEGRGSGILGAHFSCMNQQTTGICMIGNFNSLTPSDTAFASLKQLLAWESCDKNVVLTDTSIHPSSQLNLPHVGAHRDGNLSSAPNSCAVGTVCPGDSLYVRFWDRSVAPAAALACTQGVSLNEHTQLSFELYPNPARESVEIRVGDSFTSATIHLRLLSLDGKSLWQDDIRHGQRILTINTKDLTSGLYLIEVRQGHKVERKLLIRE